MTKYLFVFILTLFSIQTKAQSDSCGLLKNLHYKNGMAHLMLKATYKEIDRGSPLDIALLRNLQKHGLLQARDYSSSLVFVPEGCGKVYMAACNAKSKAFATLIKMQAPRAIYISITVFEKYKQPYSQTEPFYVVDQISLSKI